MRAKPDHRHQGEQGGTASKQATAATQIAAAIANGKWGLLFLVCSAEVD